MMWVYLLKIISKKNFGPISIIPKFFEDMDLKTQSKKFSQLGPISIILKIFEDLSFLKFLKMDLKTQSEKFS